jgi:hypothetical protein
VKSSLGNSTAASAVISSISDMLAEETISAHENGLRPPERPEPN